MKLTSKQLALAASFLLALAASARAQNNAVAPADLIVTFQNPGGSQGASSILVAVAGTTNGTASAAFFRDAAETAPGAFTNLTNIDAALDAAFGPNWQEQPTLFMAGFVNRGTTDVNTTLGGDPQRTVYFTRPRNSVGTPGFQNSISASSLNNSNFNTVSQGMAALKAQFESSASDGTALPANSSQATTTFTTTFSSVDDQLPVTAGGVQGAAFSVINGGIQDGFFGGPLGVFGGAGVIELALDLFRAQPLNNISGQSGFGAPTGDGEFLGTLSINSAGALGFTAAVPEPSPALLGGMIALFTATLRRRPKNPASVS